AALDAGWVEPRRSLGLLFELIGNHNLAAQQFSQILEIEPGNLEARLHLGVQSGRLGRDRAARDHLEPLLTCGESWIEIVAAEELARLDLRRRRPGAAEATLRSARERHPGDLQLALQLAAVLEDRGRRADAARLLAAFPEGGAAGAPTRHRYIPVPEENRRVVRERLAALAAPQERTPPQEQAAPQPPE